MSIHQKVLYIKPIRLAIASCCSGICIGYGLAIIGMYSGHTMQTGAIGARMEHEKTQKPVIDDVHVSEEKGGVEQIEGVDEGSAEKGSSQTVFGSKSGKSYYFPWCGAGARIKEENRRVFESVQQANAAGYTRAKNCSIKPES